MGGKLGRTRDGRCIQNFSTKPKKVGVHSGYLGLRVCLTDSSAGGHGQWRNLVNTVGNIRDSQK